MLVVLMTLPEMRVENLLVVLMTLPEMAAMEMAMLVVMRKA